VDFAGGGSRWPTTPPWWSWTSREEKDVIQNVRYALRPAAPVDPLVVLRAE
jgi:hypothetical protein